MKFKLKLLIPVLLFSFSSIAQVNFSNRNDLLNDGDMHSAVPVGIADMNGDGLDDIVTLNRGTNLFIQYQTPGPARPFVRYELPVIVDGDAQNDICIADFNNDGANDIITVGSYDNAKVLYNIPYTYEYNLEYIDSTSFFSQGASSGDFNGDGWVDVVVLNDNGLNESLINDGTGILDDREFFNFVTVPPSDNSGNYGSVYTDFDMDGDNDFYIAKCRQGVNNPNDPRRINVLFVNDGNNNYTQDAANYGLASGHQTWTADFGDIDNDGDQDVFFTQHDVISELFENIDNDTFINITASSGLNIGGIPLQGMFRDFDNDGFQDILVSGDRVDYYQNNGDKTFTKLEPFGGTIFGTFSLGDLNTDGFTDVYASTVIPFNNPDLVREDILFMNEPNGNHFLSLKLTDTLHNPSAIGAMAILYGPWGIQIREVRGGEQYGVSNSHTMIFGLAKETSYDSLIIRWPDGSRETYNDLAVDQSWSIRRGGCVSTSLQLWPHVVGLCDQDSVVLKLEDGFGEQLWSTGSIEDSIIVMEIGLYYAILSNENGCLQKTLPVEVITEADSIRPKIIYGGNLKLCKGDVAFLSLPNGLSYEWSSGETEQTISVTESGDYFASVQGYCINQVSDTISLDFLHPATPVTQQDTFIEGEDAILLAIGDSIVWSADPYGIFVIGTGPLLVLHDLTVSTTFYAQNFEAIEGRDFQVGPIQHQGNKYNAAFVNGGLLFDVKEPVLLEEFTIYTDSVGTRIIEITNGSDFFYEQQVDLDSGANIISLDVGLPEGSYTISTNTDQNNLVFSVASPYLWRSSAGVDYPYEISDVISITNSTYGMEFYYYFYDWKISTFDRYCGSEIVPVTAVEDFPEGINDPLLEELISVSPNPTHGLTNIQVKVASAFSFELMDLDGVKLYEDSHSGAGEFNLDLSSYPCGMYVLRINMDGKIITKKIARL